MKFLSLIKQETVNAFTEENWIFSKKVRTTPVS